MIDTWLAWGRGPVFWFAITFAVLGLTRLFVLALWDIIRAYIRAGDRTIPYKALAKATRQWMIPVNVAKARVLYGVATIAFHVAIILTPILLAGHIGLIQRGTGLWWPAMPNILADVLTVAAVLAVLALIVQRLARPETRAASSWKDHAALLLIAVPFASGFLVMHPGMNPLPFDATLLMHVMSADLVLILIPLTKLSHCMLMPLSQVVAEMAWHWPPDAGHKLAIALNKEKEPI